MAVCQFDSRVDEIHANLLRAFDDAVRADVDIQAGCAWYPEARKIVREWSAHYNLPIATVAAVIAALSPQCSWERNLIAADDVLADRVVSVGGALHANVRKARIIRIDENLKVRGGSLTLEPFMRTYFPGGPKVNSFARNLAGFDDCVTIDVHALQCALNDVGSRHALPWRPYRVFEVAYQRAAIEVGLPPPTFQAILWLYWKRRFPLLAKRHIRQQWDFMGQF